MIFLLLAHATLGICGAALIYQFSGFVPTVSFAVGAGLGLFSLTALVVTWPNLLAKKLVALSISVIVFKFAILVWILYKVAAGDLFGQQINAGWFAGGMALVVLSVLAAAVKESRRESERSSIDS